MRIEELTINVNELNEEVKVKEQTMYELSGRIYGLESEINSISEDFKIKFEVM
jgi:hypothetical protein